MRLRWLSLVGVVLLWIGGCAVNPVTGERELSFVSESQELDMGRQYYAPSRQMQGGDYVLEPQLSDYVSEVGSRLAAVSDRDLPYEFVILNSSLPNAWALPGGKIAINRGLLLELEDESALAAVLGHEIVHAAARHSAQSMTRGMILQGAVLGTAIATQDENYANLIVGGAGFAAQLLTQRYSRNAELEADRYGMDYMSRAGYNPAGAVQLQEAFVRLSEGRNENWLSGLFASHPPSTERVEKNREHAASLPVGGITGRESYQKMIAGLKTNKPAYDAYDEGRKAYAADDMNEALRLARQAINMEPREAQFHALRGDIRFQQKRYQDAKINYDRAIDRGPAFFYYYLQRGLVEAKLGNDLVARQDLENSIKLLPTATAHNALGELAESRGDIDAAVGHFRAAAGSSSNAGRSATAALLRIDLPRNPGQYLGLRHGLDEQGRVIIEVSNPTSVAVREIEVSIRYRDVNGQVRETSGRLPYTLAPGQSVHQKTSWGPFATTGAYQVALTGAAIAK